MTDNASDVPVELSRTGRFANFGASRLDYLARAHGRLHSWVYARFSGTRFGTWMGRPVFRLTVLGRSSGKPRSVVLMQLRDGDDIVVVGSHGGKPTTPNWWHNLVAAETAIAQVGRESWPVTVRVVTEPAEYAERWQALVDFYPDLATYKALSTRHFPIAVLTRAAEG